MTLTQAAEEYATAVRELALADTTREETYYPALRTLVQRALGHLGLPADVRQNTSERRRAGGRDLPDLALYDGGGDFATVCFEVKVPGVDLRDLAFSTDGGDQVGRYLAQTGVVVLTNVRSFGLLTPEPGFTGEGPVPPERRRLNHVVEVWPSAAELHAGDRPRAFGTTLADLLEEAATRFAPIAEPETLARVLARQAKRAKAALPPAFTSAVGALADDFASALGITFKGEEGEVFFRSSLVQTVYYGLFAGWMLWARDGVAAEARGEGERTEVFHWRDLADHLRLPFLSQLFHEIQHPRRLEELGLRDHLDHATETLGRVDRARFFARLNLSTVGRPAAEGETVTDDGANAEVRGIPEPGEARRALVQTVSRSIASAVVYFYEPFLETFDPDLRKDLGVWYTPPEVVRYQVRRVDALLRELGCRRGLADEAVVVLDPACGTGAYLIEVLACMAETLWADGVEDELGETLLRALQSRVRGFEILTAPFVVAHLQLHLLLSELGATPGPEHRPGVFLTNALTGWRGGTQLALNFPELQEERDAALAVKTEARIIVVLGNPPYNRYAGVPVEEEGEILDAYQGIRRNAGGKAVGTTQLYAEYGVRKQVLHDLYVRFFRIAEERIGVRAEHGVVSLITNGSYLRGRSHPLMRESLLHHFDEVWVDNLNGDKYRTGKVVPEGEPGAGGPDESVFSTERDARGIQPGVAITTLMKRRGERTGAARVHYRDFWGRAVDKRRALLESVGASPPRLEAEAAVRPEGPRPYETFSPTRARRWKLMPYEAIGGFDDWYGLDQLFPAGEQGVNPNRGRRGGGIEEIDRETLAARMRDYFSDLPFEAFRDRHPELAADRASYEAGAVRDVLRAKSGFDPDALVDYVVFPLDVRYIYYERAYYQQNPDRSDAIRLLNRRRPTLGDNLDGNEFLVAVPEARQVSEGRPLFTTALFDLHLHDRGSVGFPAEIPRTERAADLFTQATPPTNDRQANLDPAFWEIAKERWGLEGDLGGDDARAFVRRLFRACLALLHAPAYQDEHRDALSQEWARVPLPLDYALFERAAQLGERVAVLLDPLAHPDDAVREVLGERARSLAQLRRAGGGPVREDALVVEIPHFGGAIGGWKPIPEDAREPEGRRRGNLWISDAVYFEDVPETVWRFALGGYPVLKKWLGYRDARRRERRPLTLGEKDHFRGMVRRLAALLAIYPELDTLYERALDNAWLLPEEGATPTTATEV